MIPRTPTMGSLFAGIGGFDLGFERAGFTTSWQVEIDPYCRKVLAKHFPEAERFEDVRECGKHNLRPVDVICGGFPCQDISVAGKGAGIDGERSGLWREFARIIGELRPRFAVVENVPALLGRGISRVLGDLAEIGYDTEWEVISAADVGAPHLRERVWIVAYPTGEQNRRLFESRLPSYVGAGGELMADASRIGRQGERKPRFSEGVFTTRVLPESLRSGSAFDGEDVAYTASLRRSGSRKSIFGRCLAEDGEGKADQPFPVGIGNQWATEPDVGRVAHGIPARVDRLKGLGNAVVPQIPELIASRLKEIL